MTKEHPKVKWNRRMRYAETVMLFVVFLVVIVLLLLTTGYES